MSLTEKDFDEVRLARPVPVLDLFDLDDRIDRLEAVAERLERAVLAFAELYRSERVKNWELILKAMMEKRESGYGHRTG